MFMKTPFDTVVEEIKHRGYHNHRLQKHSDIVSEGIYTDLVASCDSLRDDVNKSVVKHWLIVKTPGARNRKIDLLIGEPDKNGNPDLDKVRICIENKSVITAHRNRDARFDDLNETLQVIHKVRSEAVMVATVMIGEADRVLNVPDRIKMLVPGDDFNKRVLPRLSTGDQSLWDEFKWAISDNRKIDPELTIEKFRKLPLRSAALTHVVGYDYLLLVPVHIDNVNPPYIPRPNHFGIDVDAEYDSMRKKICAAYAARWHL
jgi:hypothetical protein